MSPLDLSGPDFLVLWFWGAFAVAGLTLVVRRIVRGRREGAEQLATELGPYDLAYLEGGIERALEAAIVGLHHRGAIDVVNGKIVVMQRDIAVDAEGVFRGIPGPDRLPPIERLVVDHGDESVREVLSRARSLNAGFAARALSNGLVIANRTRARLLVALPGIAWIAFGFAKAAVGIARDRPTGFLVLLLAFAVLAVAFGSRVPRRTLRGDAVLAAAKRRSYGLEATAKTAKTQLTSEDAALAYGLFGHTTLAGLALLLVMPSYQQSLLVATNSAARDGGACGSASGCGGGSGCSGGGGGGGGGCGGCS